MIKDFKHGKIIFSVLVGSHAHGTNTESSDEDYKHIYIQSPEDVIENGYKRQIDINKDEVVYELGRFVELALKGNPTMLEILFIPEDCIKYKHPLIQPLLDNRKEFLCKALKLPFIGYSFSQIEKAQGLNKKMNWEKDKTVRKTVLDFCYVIDPDDQFNTLPLKDYLKRENRKQEHYGLSKINHFTDCYMMYYDVQAELSSSNPKFTSTVFNYKGIVQDEDKSNEVSLSDIPKYAQRDAVMFWNKNEYQRHCREYREYTEWLNKRNTQRYVDIENHNQRIDGKNVSHCIRLIDSAIDIVKYKDFIVRRPNASFLIDVRKGKYSLEKVLEYCNKKIITLDEEFDKSDLPQYSNKDLIEKIIKNIRYLHYGKKTR